MKLKKLDPMTFVATLSTLVAVVALSGMFQTASQVALVLRGPVQVLGVPTPQQMMRVVEGTSFTVPSGKVLVCTGLGLSSIGASSVITLSFDGSAILSARPSFESATANVAGFGPSISTIPPGLTASAGEVISVASNGSVAVCFGYLADA